jgi:hypothetical protein
MITSHRIFTVLDGKLVNTASDINPEHKEYHVKCQDCELDKTYRFRPGQKVHPKWLWERVEMLQSHYWTKTGRKVGDIY